MKFPQFLDTVKFYKVVSRKESPLILGFMSYGFTQQKENVNALGFKHDIRHFIYLDGDIYFDLTEVEGLKEIILKISKKDESIFLEMARKCEMMSKNIIAFTEKVEKSDLEHLEFDQLIVYFKEYFQLMGEYIPYLIMPLAVEKIYQEKIDEALKQNVSPEKVEEYLGTLIFPEKPNRDYYESLSFLDLVTMKDDPSLKEKIKEHLNKFAKTGQRFGFGKFWTEEEIIKRIEEYSGKDPVKEKEKVIQRKKENKVLTEKILIEINASPELREEVKIIKEYAFLRTHRTETISLSYANMNKLFAEIGKRNDLTFADISHCTYWEIVNKNFPAPEVLQARKEKVGFIRNGDEFLVLTKNELDEARKHYGLEEEIGDSGQVTGKMANKGKVQGTVKVVMDNSQLDKVEKGDILITAMTTPDFVSAMEKAAAFVTDEGGILCHAAIISREMNKPCVIATKIATKIFKDGDLVEVDANKGVVKKIK
jgi:phosphoenolpyruvate synthase/pyruvate phosphate dikinase